MSSQFAMSKWLLLIPVFTMVFLLGIILQTNPNYVVSNPPMAVHTRRSFIIPINTSVSSTTTEAVPEMEQTEEVQPQPLEKPSSPLCPEYGSNVQLVIAVTSSPDHSKARLTIRQTWGHYGSRKDVSVGFLIGTTDNDDIEAKLQEENDLYSDLIRGDFVDSYKNLTFKTMFMLKWASDNCPMATFLLKTDDDMFINVEKLLGYTETLNSADRTLYGYLLKNRVPFRNTTSKYYVSKKQYKSDTYPDFVTGPAYLVPLAVAKELYDKSFNYPYFHLEDVFITGIVARDLNITRVQAPGFINRKVSWSTCKIRQSVSFHKISQAQMFDMWKMQNAGQCKS